MRPHLPRSILTNAQTRHRGWIITILTGCGVLIFLSCWLSLFIWYNAHAVEESGIPLSKMRQPRADDKVSLVRIKSSSAEDGGMEEKPSAKSLLDFSKHQYWQRPWSTQGRALTLDRQMAALFGRPERDTTSPMYVTFEDDCGGFNNLRIAWETFVLTAKLLERTLVLPPRAEWYLLDTGPIVTFDKEKERLKNKRTTSGYEDYFDMPDLQQQLDVIDTFTFLNQAGGWLNVPSDATPNPLQPDRNGVHTPYFMFLRSHPFTYIWPTGPAAMTARNIAASRAFRIVHFPCHVSLGLRYQMGNHKLLSALSAGKFKTGTVSSEESKVARGIVSSSMVFLERHLHYVDEIAETADAVIQFLGGFGSFSCMHIRRNELQFKQVFVDASVSFNNVAKGLHPGEKIYLATDENQPNFFQPFEDAGHPIVRLSDVSSFMPKVKLQGMIEQFICAKGARMFAGTSMSSFSSYIFRLRQYHHKSGTSGFDTRCWLHDRRQEVLGACHHVFAYDANFVYLQ